MTGLYIHIPFCIKKCRYCDFVSFSGMTSNMDSYIDALLSEALKYKGIAVDTVFVGGGTPTILEAEQLERLFRGVKKCFCISPDAEISVEANPKTLDRKKLLVLKKAGVNRLSIGVQSFSDIELQFLGRVHTANEAEQTVRIASEYFDNLNIDLMFSLPGQTKETVLQSLKKTVALGVSHISAYSLILEEGTELYKEYESGRLMPVDGDADRDMFNFICKFLNKSGYNRYEISNFSKTGMECKHNLKYWDCEEYIGIGTAAHSYLGGERFSNTTDLKEYLSDKTELERTVLTKSDKMSEFMIMGLRKTEGISLSDFNSRFLCNAYDIFDIEKFEKVGLIVRSGERIALSAHGLDVSNSILCEFV